MLAAGHDDDDDDDNVDIYTCIWMQYIFPLIKPYIQLFFKDLMS